LTSKPRLRELIAKAKNGDAEAMTRLVGRLIPLVKKYSRRLGYEDACSDLVTRIIEAVHRYRPHTT